MKTFNWVLLVEISPRVFFSVSTEINLNSRKNYCSFINGWILIYKLCTEVWLRQVFTYFLIDTDFLTLEDVQIISKGKKGKRINGHKWTVRPLSLRIPLTIGRMARLRLSHSVWLTWRYFKQFLKRHRT